MYIPAREEVWITECSERCEIDRREDCGCAAEDAVRYARLCSPPGEEEGKDR